MSLTGLQYRRGDNIVTVSRTSEQGCTPRIRIPLTHSHKDQNACFHFSLWTLWTLHDIRKEIFFYGIPCILPPSCFLTDVMQYPRQYCVGHDQLVLVKVCRTQSVVVHGRKIGSVVLGLSGSTDIVVMWVVGLG